MPCRHSPPPTRGIPSGPGARFPSIHRYLCGVVLVRDVDGDLYAGCGAHRVSGGDHDRVGVPGLVVQGDPGPDLAGLPNYVEGPGVGAGPGCR